MHVKLDLFEVAEKNKDKKSVDLSWKKAIRPKEAILFHNKYTLDDINLFIMYRKQLHVQMDRKRIWYNDPPTFGKLLEDTYESDPLCLN